MEHFTHGLGERSFIFGWIQIGLLSNAQQPCFQRVKGPSVIKDAFREFQGFPDNDGKSETSRIQ